MRDLSEKRQKTDVDCVKLYRDDLDRINSLPNEEKTLVLSSILQLYDDFGSRDKKRERMPDINAPPYNIPPHLSRFGAKVLGCCFRELIEYWHRCEVNAENRSKRNDR